MDFTLFLVRVLHIGVAMAWFAIPLAVVSTIKLGMRHGQAAFVEAVRIADRRGLMAAVAGLLTLATGLWAIFYRGGFKFVQPTIHAAMGLVVVMLVLSVAVMKPISGKLKALGEAGRHESPEARGLIRRAAMTSGVLQLLWTVVLVLMVWR